MSKALVIKNSNFYTNSLDSIEYNDIPCTGLSLASADTIMLAGDTLALTATVTPSNCTDPLQWSSSNNSAATVNENGIITCVGDGTATITAVCGAYSATHTIHCVAFDLDVGYVFTTSAGYVVNNKRCVCNPLFVKVPENTRVEIQLTNTSYTIGYYILSTDDYTADILTATSTDQYKNEFSSVFTNAYTDGEKHTWSNWSEVPADTEVYFCMYFKKSDSTVMSSSDATAIKAALSANFVHNAVT